MLDRRPNRCPAEPGLQPASSSQRLSTTYARAVANDASRILDDAIERLKLTETSTTLAQRVEAAAAPDSALLTITARDGDPGRAAAIANAPCLGVDRGITGPGGSRRGYPDGCRPGSRRRARAINQTHG